MSPWHDIRYCHTSGCVVTQWMTVTHMHPLDRHIDSCRTAGPAPILYRGFQRW